MYRHNAGRGPPPGASRSAGAVLRSRQRDRYYMHTYKLAILAALGGCALVSCGDDGGLTTETTGATGTEATADATTTPTTDPTTTPTTGVDTTGPGPTTGPGTTESPGT